MGVTNGRFYILPPNKEFFGYRPYDTHIKNPVCNIPNKVRYISVWNEDNQEWQTLQCSQTLFDSLENARAELKREYPFREAIVTIKGT